MNTSTQIYDIGLVYYNENTDEPDALLANMDKFEYTEKIHHTVVSGENLYDISLKYYDNMNLWFIIAIYNRDKILNPFELPVGVELEFPTKNELETMNYGS